MFLLLLAGFPLRFWAVQIIRGTARAEGRDTMLRDDLTGLWKRGHFMQVLEEKSAERDSELALLFLDIDNFKSVNDTFGHQMGDKVLAAASSRIPDTVANMRVSRFGGDEMVILLENSTRSEAEFVAADLVHRFRKPFLIDGEEIHLSLSVGVALSDGGSTPGSQLLRQADFALYEAKAAGRNCWRFFKTAPTPTPSLSLSA